MPYIKVKAGSVNGFGPGTHEVTKEELESIKSLNLTWVEEAKGAEDDDGVAYTEIDRRADESTTVTAPTKQQKNQAIYEAKRHDKGRTSDHELKPLAETLGDFDDTDRTPPQVGDAAAFNRKLRRAGGGALTSKDLLGAVETATSGEIAHQPTGDESPDEQKAKRKKLDKK